MDDERLQSERLQLWNNLNLCWLAVLQRQFQSTQEMIVAGHPPSPPQTILPQQFLEKMGHELVRLCDGLERYGLVDYQMGIWEEEIIDSK